MNLTLFGAVYLSIPKNIFDLCSGVQLSYMEIIWSFCVLLLWFLLRRCGSVLSLMLVISHCSGKTSLSSQFPLMYEFFHLFSGNRHCFHPCVSTCTVPSNAFECVFPPALVVFLCMCWSSLGWICRGPFAEPGSSSLCAALTSGVLTGTLAA